MVGLLTRDPATPRSYCGKSPSIEYQAGFDRIHTWAVTVASAFWASVPSLTRIVVGSLVTLANTGDPQMEQNALNAPGEDSYSRMSSRPDNSLYDVTGTRTFAENAVPLARRQRASHHRGFR